MPDGADVAGTSHHDFNADGGDYGTDYGVHDATGDYTGTYVGAPDVADDYVGGDVGFTGTLSADQVSSLQENISGLDRLGENIGKFLDPRKNIVEYSIAGGFSALKNVTKMIQDKKRMNEPITAKDIKRCINRTLKEFGALYVINQTADFAFDSAIDNFKDNYMNEKLKLERAIGHADANSETSGAFGIFLDILNKRKELLPSNPSISTEKTKNILKWMAGGIWAFYNTFVGEENKKHGGQSTLENRESNERRRQVIYNGRGHWASRYGPPKY